MKKQLLAVFFLIANWITTNGQNCDPTTPVFNVDLTGQPNGTWISPAVVRNGDCCVTASNCVQFNLTLDSNANLINFYIYSGAAPGGSMYYQINCGPQISLGTPICLTGPGPYVITFCKPGNNSNQYAITSIGAPALNGTRIVSQACTGMLIAEGLNLGSIQWTSVPSNPIYDSYLNCTSGCDTVTISPPIGSAPAFIDYQVCGTVAGGCLPITFCDTIRVNFVNTLGVTINPANPTICFGGTNAFLTATGSGGEMPYTYLWSTGETTDTVTKGPGTYTVQVFDQMNCSIAMDTVIVQALPSPITADAGPDGNFCLKYQSFQLAGNVIVASGGQWIGAGTFNPSSTDLNAQYTPTLSEISNGYANLQLISTGNSGCPADTDDIRLNIYYNPVPNIVGTSQACMNSTTQYSTPNVAGNSYQWSVTGGGSIANANQSVADVQWTTTGSYQLSVLETNAAGCDSLKIFNINVMPKPTPSISGPGIACSYKIMQYQVSGINPNETIQWNITGGVIQDSSNGSTIHVVWTVLGFGDLNVVVTNQYGCDSTVYYSVNVLETPLPQLSGPNQACKNDTCVYTVQFVNGHNYDWQISGGFILSNSANQISVFWQTFGTNTITITESTPSGCDSSASMSVTVNPKPVPVLNGIPMVCEDENAIITTTAVNNSSYVWTAPGGNIISGNSTPTVTCAWPDSGIYSITLIELNQFGCYEVVSIPVAVAPKPNVNITGSVYGCTNSNSTIVVSQSPASTYQYSITGGIIQSNVFGNMQVAWTSTGSNSISVYAINNSTGCSSQNTLNVNVQPVPKPVINTNNFWGCPPLDVTFNNNLVNSNYTYSWAFGEGTNSTDPNPAHTFNATGNFHISVMVTNNTGCVDSAWAIVNVFPKPESDFNIGGVGDVIYAEFQNLVLTNLSSGAISYSWDFGNGDVSNKFEPTYIYTKPGFYDVNLEVVNMYGCRHSRMKQIEVKVTEDVFVPTAFTPNDDHINDFFSVGYKNIESATISIYDRWGERIYQTTDLDFKWNGNYNGRKIENGTYVYLINAIGYYKTVIKRTGKVTVLY